MHRTILLFTIIFSTFKIDDATPLDDYVKDFDPNFGWKILQRYPYSTHTIYVLNMTSQKWLNSTIIIVHPNNNIVILFLASFSSQPIWWHHMIITIPKLLRRSKTAFMLIGDGYNSDP